MKILEITDSSVDQAIDNIKTVLKTEPDNNLLNRVEKFIKGKVKDSNDIQTDNEKDNEEEITESHDSTIDNIAKMMKVGLNNGSIDIKEIYQVESILRRSSILKRIDNLWTARGWDGSRRLSIYKDIFAEDILNSRSPLLDKIRFLYMVTSNNVAIQPSVFEKTFKGNLDDIIPPKFLQNATFEDIKKKIFFSNSYRGKGIGPGEFALSLLGKKGIIVDHGGDVNIDGWGIEIKDGKGGSIKTGSSNQFRNSDKLRKWIGQQVGVSFPRLKAKDIGAKKDKQIKLDWKSKNEFTDAYNNLDNNKKQNITTKYIQELYPELEPENQKILISGLMKDAGTPDVVYHFGQSLLKSYQSQDDWDSILLININGNISNIVDFDNLKGIASFVLAGINRDGDTQALPDGYINAKN